MHWVGLMLGEWGVRTAGQPDLGLEDLYPGLHRAAQLTCYTEGQNSLIGGRSCAVSRKVGVGITRQHPGVALRLWRD